MDNVLIEIITQWGLAGLVMIAAGWIIFDNYRTNKKKVQGESTGNFNIICKLIDDFKSEQQKFNSLIFKRITKLESKVDGNSEEMYDIESKRMSSLVQLVPTLHTILKTSINNCNADHIYLATFHNGIVGVTGIPFFKFDVIAEKFDPIVNTKDVEMSKYYNGENISRHNKLGTILFQHESVLFDLSKNDTLKDIDQIEYNRCTEIGVKQIIYKSITDSHGYIAGFLCAYSYENDLNTNEFDECVDNIESAYKNLIDLIGQ